MAECKDISERLLMALDPEEFPEVAREVREHLEACSVCKAELELLGRITEFLREHSEELAPATISCPPAEALVAVALGEPVEAATSSHVGWCPECSQHVEIARSLAADESSRGQAVPDEGQRQFLRLLVNREHGAGRIVEEERQRSWADFFRSLFHLPSVALAAAATVAVAIWLQIPAHEALQPVFSDAVWSERETPISKSLRMPKAIPITKQSVAVMIFSAGKEGPPPEELQSVYGRLDIPERLRASYEFVTPREIKQAFAGADGERSLDAWAEVVLAKLPVDRFLAFELSRVGADYSLKAALYERGQPAAVRTATQTGLTAELVSSRMNSMGVELLTEGAPG